MSTTVDVLSIVDSRTQAEHLIAMETAAAHRHLGRYPAMCGAEVIAASLTTLPASDCDECLTLAQPTVGKPKRARDQRRPLLPLRRGTRQRRR